MKAIKQNLEFLAHYSIIQATHDFYSRLSKAGSAAFIKLCKLAYKLAFGRFSFLLKAGLDCTLLNLPEFVLCISCWLDFSCYYLLLDIF